MPKFVAFTSLGRRALPNQFRSLRHRRHLRRPDRRRPRRQGRGDAAAGTRRDRHPPRVRLPALLRAAHDLAHVHRARVLVAVHLHLRDARGEKPACRDGDDPTARRAAIGADPRLPRLSRGVLRQPLPRLRRGLRGGLHLRDLHEPGLEHGVLVLPVAAQPARRPRRGGEGPAPHAVAAVLAARDPLRHAGPHLEHDDVDVGRLVLRRRLRGDRGGRQHDKAARDRLVHRGRQRQVRLRRDRRGGGDDGRRHPRLRPAPVPSARRLRRALPRRAPRRPAAGALVGDGPLHAHPLAAPVVDDACARVPAQWPSFASSCRARR